MSEASNLGQWAKGPGTENGAYDIVAVPAGQTDRMRMPDIDIVAGHGKHDEQTMKRGSSVLRAAGGVYSGHSGRRGIANMALNNQLGEGPRTEDPLEDIYLPVSKSGDQQ